MKSAPAGRHKRTPNAESDAASGAGRAECAIHRALGEAGTNLAHKDVSEPITVLKVVECNLRMMSKIIVLALSVETLVFRRLGPGTPKAIKSSQS